MNGSTHPGDITRDAMASIAGFYGTKPISGTSEHLVQCFGFHASEDTVIEYIHSATHDVGAITGWAGKTVLAGEDAWFGMAATSIKLTSGSGTVFLSSSIVPPSAPYIIKAESNEAGDAINITFSKEMANPSSLLSSFNLVIDGDPAVIDSVSSSSEVITLAPSASLDPSYEIKVSIDASKIKSTDGAYFAGVTELLVSNLTL